ncbi:MAG: amino acid permease [Phycisphaerales bacterium]|nr:amino acid permease [Phycisphaerales bacterium]
MLGATGIGVGAIVGGGILALAGVAFAATGPSAVLAFALNGVIAVITALSFAELATRFPESGGTYAFAKKVLSIEAAFTVGWVVWFASIVAAALYAVGFGVFLMLAVAGIAPALVEGAPAWLGGRAGVVLIAGSSTAVLALGLLRSSGGGGAWLNIGKLAVFAVLLAAGLAQIAGAPGSIRTGLEPFFAAGGLGLVQAMGFTFIALQGFDLIAAIGGEVRDPRRTIPRAMLFSLAIALAIYLPLLLIVATVGMPEGRSVQEVAAEAPEAIVAIAAQNYLGAFGYWLVIVAGVLSMLSALQANLLAASRVALTMARDRTLPAWLEAISLRRRTPWAAVLATAAVVILVLTAVPDVASVGAASSLVFLVTFALAQRLTVMARRRADPGPGVFRVPLFPVLPLTGAAACVALAVFQGISVPSAGIIACVWLAIGGVLYGSVFSRRARSVDAFSQAMDGELVRLRGRSPLVLVPVANPDRAEALVGVANALAPPRVGRVMLLNIVREPEADSGAEADPTAPALANVQAVVREAMTASFVRHLKPEVLVTVAGNPWPEIARVAGTHRCESLVVGFSRLDDPDVGGQLEKLMGRVSSEVVVVHARPGWRLDQVKRVLVPTGGRGGHDVLRARLLGSIHRLGAREITLLRVLPPTASDREVAQAKLALTRIVHDEVPHEGRVVVTRTAEVADTIAEHAADCDLIVLGMRRTGKRRKSFGNVVLALAERVPCGIVMISHRG